MKLVSFDLEISKQLPEDVQDWKEHRPLGISCAAAYDGVATEFWSFRPENQLTESPKDIVHGLRDMVNRGRAIVTWNGLSFDFSVLAEESGMYQDCKMLALNHIDLMFIVVTLRGHYLGLDKAAKGMGIQGKLKQVILNDGTALKDMSGGKAPALWAAREYQAVLDYLGDDVRSTLELAKAVKEHGGIAWKSDRGYPQSIRVPKLYTVNECLKLRRNIPGWVTDPVSLISMMEWIK